MNTKLLFFNLVSALVILMSIPTGTVHGYEADQAEISASSRVLQRINDLLPAGTSVPENLPTTVTDPILLAGWVYLYNQQEPVKAWNGKTLTGRELAEIVIDRNVTIRWNLKNECQGASCTDRPVCRLDSTCQGKATNPDRVDIIITTNYQNRNYFDIRRLAGTIGHEMVHYLMPFGGPDDTLYEEFWAFTIGSQISRKGEFAFNGYNPLKESCLKLWFQKNMGNFFDFLTSYPPSVQQNADTQDTNCTIVQRLPGETDGLPSGR